MSKFRQIRTNKQTNKYENNMAYYTNLYILTNPFLHVDFSMPSKESPLSLSQSQCFSLCVFLVGDYSITFCAIYNATNFRNFFIYARQQLSTMTSLVTRNVIHRQEYSKTFDEHIFILRTSFQHRNYTSFS